MKKTMILILALIFALSVILISSACTLEPVFEDIVISSGVEEGTYEPLDTKTEFEASAENIYATIKFSNVKGDDNFRFKWTNLDTGGIVIDYEDQYAKDQKGKYSSVVWTKISSQDFQLKIIASGDYKVEFYHNGEVVKTTTFKVNKPEVTEEVAEAMVTFDQGNEYSATDFGFTITLPDNWTYEENKTEQEDIVTIVPPSSQDTPVWLQFSAVNPEPYLPYGDFADTDSASVAEQQGWTFVEKIESDSTLPNGAPCKEYSYLYTDDDNLNWIMGYAFAENNGTLYILIVIADQSNSSMAIDAYIGILNSLIFN